MALTLEKVREAVVAVIAPGNFFVGNGLDLEWEHRDTEDLDWEVYKGRLLDRTQTRQRCTFEAWNLFAVEAANRSDEPILSIKLDRQRDLIHVVRAILSYAWEPYDAGDSVILTREATKWARELVRTICIADMPADFDLKRELTSWLRKAVLGTSRLPLTSLESPLPAFSLGQFAYFPCEEQSTGCTSPMRSWHELIQRRISDQDQHQITKLLEFLLRNVSWPELGEMTCDFVRRFFQVWPEAEQRRSLVALFTNLFNEISLTPCADFIDKSLQFLAILESQKHLWPEDTGDCLGQLLRQLGRHLTAYDLVTFHHRGANYPDALLLDALLRSCRELLDREPSVFLSIPGEDGATAIRKRLRRRGLRQGWLLRRHYEGHLVPDAPTSPGENIRVLPSPHARVPEEQIHNPPTRSKLLYENDPLERYQGKTWLEALGQSIADLSHPDELRELGMALFLDRPLGHGAGLLERDGTPLLSYLAFSPSIARARLCELTSVARLMTDRRTVDGLFAEFDQLQVRGIPVKAVADPHRQAIVSLNDALRVADDFVLLRNTTSSWSVVRQIILDADRIENIAFLREDLEKPGLFLRVAARPGGQASLVIYDDQVRRRVELEFDPGKAYRSCGEIECPTDPIRVIRIWETEPGTEGLRERDLSAAGIFLNRSQGRL